MKNTIKNIIIISAGYPNERNIYKYKFLEQLVNCLAKNDIRITVISPIYNNHRSDFYKEEWNYTIKNKDGKEITIKVYQPLIFNFTTKKIGSIRMGVASYISFKHAVDRIIQKNKIKPDILYAHFITPSGCIAAELGEKYRIPSICAVGESNILETFQALGKDYIQKRFKKISGVVSVSTKNKEILEQLELCPEKPIEIIPNAVDQNIYFPHDKYKMREKYGFRNSDIIGIFVGAFIDRKGVERVSQAAEIARIKMIYIGNGEQEPSGSNVLFKGVVDHDNIPDYLSAADFFVLPTKEEGCCNAIIEAVSCGLPIISSIGRFNDDILNSKYAIRVNPESVDEISAAMNLLAENHELRREMSKSSCKARVEYNIDERAKKIIAFMESLTRRNEGNV